jgi:hypothetical protein
MIDYSRAGGTLPQQMTVPGRRQQFDAVLATTRYLSGPNDVTGGTFYLKAMTKKVDPTNVVFVLNDIQISPGQTPYVYCCLVAGGTTSYVYVWLSPSTTTVLGYAASRISSTAPA